MRVSKQNNQDIKVKTEQAYEKIPPSKVNIEQWLNSNPPEVVTYLGEKREVEILKECLWDACRRNPKLLECTIQSIKMCIMASARMMLYPGFMGDCAYIPFYNSDKKVTEAVFVPMYKGLNRLAFQSGYVKSISCEVVYSKDYFEYVLGSEVYLQHKRYLADDPGDIILAYACIKTKSDDVQIKVMPMRELLAVKKKAKGSAHPLSTWNTDFDAMCRKTVLKRALNLVPLSPDLARALIEDDENEIESYQKPAIDVTENVTPVTAPPKIEHKENVVPNFETKETETVVNDQAQEPDLIKEMLDRFDENGNLKNP